MEYYRRRREPLIIPYPFLTETTDLAVSGISNNSKPLPSTATSSQWYTVSENFSLTVPAGTVLLVVREQSNIQRLFWEEAGVTSLFNVVAGDHIVLVPGTLPVITIAGFDLMALGDRFSANTNNGLIQFPANIKFRFTESN